MASKLTSLEIWYQKQFEKERAPKPNPPATEINPAEELKQQEQQEEWRRNLREQRLLEEEKRRIEQEKWRAIAAHRKIIAEVPLKETTKSSVKKEKTQRRVEKEKIEGLNNLKDLAANGNNYAIIQVAKIYENAKSKGSDVFSCYIRAADTGDIYFCKKVARMFAYGVDTERNDDKAIEYCKKIFPNATDAECIRFFANDVTFYSNFQKFHWYKKAADIGNRYFGIKVAKMFAYGAGTEQNDDKAIEYYKKFFPNATDIECARFFAENTKSKTNKFRWYKKAADLGDKNSYTTVARMFAYGLGTEQNDAKAIKYYKKIFSITIAECAKFFAENTKSKTNKFHWYKKAADLGDKNSCITVARMFAYGLGTEQNDAKAIKYYKKIFPNATDAECIRFFAKNAQNNELSNHWKNKF